MQFIFFTLTSHNLKFYTNKKWKKKRMYFQMQFVCKLHLKSRICNEFKHTFQAWFFNSISIACSRTRMYMLKIFTIQMTTCMRHFAFGQNTAWQHSIVKNIQVANYSIWSNEFWHIFLLFSFEREWFEHLILWGCTWRYVRNRINSIRLWNINP